VVPAALPNLAVELVAVNYTTGATTHITTFAPNDFNGLSFGSKCMSVSESERELVIVLRGPLGLGTHFVTYDLLTGNFTSSPQLEAALPGILITAVAVTVVQ
jgi:hypothetical protein